MNTAESKKRYTPQEYLKLEEASLEKHEYFRGEIFAMAGGSENHSLINSNVMRVLGNLLSGKPCRVYDSNLRIHIPTTSLFTYPDASVICGPTEVGISDPSRGSILNSKVIVEILLPSTEAYDRGAKFENYLSITSLREYVLISQSAPRIETFHRQDDGTWVFSFASGMESTILLKSLEIALPLPEVYRDVNFIPFEREASAR
jgi:Uma2 family endonuclease